MALLPPSATPNERALANAIDTFVGAGGALPLAFFNLFSLSPPDLAIALAQLSGEAGTGAQQSGFQIMNSFLSLLTNPFGDRTFAPKPSIAHGRHCFTRLRSTRRRRTCCRIRAAGASGRRLLAAKATSTAIRPTPAAPSSRPARAALPPGSTTGSHPTRPWASRSPAAALHGHWRPDWAAGTPTCSRPASTGYSEMVQPIFPARSRLRPIGRARAAP